MLYERIRQENANHVPPKKCGICGSTDLQDLGAYTKTKGTVLCRNRWWETSGHPIDGGGRWVKCEAKWWNKWYTKEDWETYINIG